MSLTQPRTRLTADQFFRDLPADGKRYELIDGELREMTTPNIKHQQIARGFFRLLDPEVTRVGGQVFSPGVGIVLSDGVVQVPDLVVLTRPLEQSNLEYGLVIPPDLVIEILSPSTARYDRTEKSALYAAFGVPELWLVSPEAETIEVFALSEGRYALHARVGLDEPISSVVLPTHSSPSSAAFAV